MIRWTLRFVGCSGGLLWLLALSPALLASGQPSATDHYPVLRTGFVEFPPFKYADDDGNASGPWVEMTERVAAEAGYRLDWVHLPIARVYLSLRTGNIDLWPGVAGIPQIRDAVYESDVSPMRVVLYAFHRADVPPPENINALEDKPLILINGFTYLGALQQLTLDDRQLSYAPGHESALRMLELGRGDYVLDYDEPVQAIKHQFPDLELTGTAIFEARGAFVASRSNANARTILEKFDEAYRRLVERGQLRSLQ